MILWAMRRRLLYLSSLFIFFGVLIGIPLAFYLYEPPSCFDSKQNQGEAGSDCGGPCSLLCPNDSLPFIIDWTQKFEVTSSLWSVAAHVQNPNDTSGAIDVPYLFQLYDSDGVLIAERRNRISIRPRASLTIFEGGFLVERNPAKVVFSFTQLPVFKKMDTVPPEIVISNRTLSGEEIRPRLEATLRNNGTVSVKGVPVTAVVFDKGGNAIAASKTTVDMIEPNEATNVSFTWPQPFPVEIGYCESPADVAILLDRSSSMDDDRSTPPQPLTDVKAAAEQFVNLLAPGDQASVISFATAATNPPDQILASDQIRVQEAIRRIEIGQGVTQQTNIGDALERAQEELFSTRHNPDSKRVVVLLTDGVANYPKREGDPLFAERYALSLADSLKEKGVLLYTIGLGNELNEYFLRQIASGSGSYYGAATPMTLATIYKAIATSICRKTNTSSIDINVHLFPGVNY
jgi:Mg-chelatase subunit ChlD